uniref:Uncharacterized protein n=1 Tax=Panagrolaimus sp. PS1159 TaxID=55785 RepID=A0AC35ET24_9BILA
MSNPLNNPNLIPSILFNERKGLMQYLQKIGCSLVINLNAEECNGSVDVILNNDFYTIKNPSGKVLTPAYISFENEKVKIGEMALNDYPHNPKCVIFDVLQILGKTTFDIKPKQSWQFNVAQNPRYSYLSVIEVQTWEGQRAVTPEFALALYLKALKRYAEAATKQQFRRVAIMIPGQYRKIQHTALKVACIQAGFNLVHTMQSPRASNDQNDK